MIAFVDSGLGGLPYLGLMRSWLPSEDYVYGADNLGFPYGTKEEDAIVQSFTSMVDRILRQHRPEIFVVACNTASVVALKILRERYDLPFVGVVPAVKPAAEGSVNKRITVLATERTCKGSYLQNLVDTWALTCEVFKRPATNLIAQIENHLLDGNAEHWDALLQEIYDDVRATGSDSVVLGCTHFLLIEDRFRKLFGHDLKIFDSREGVCRQTLKLLKRAAEPGLPLGKASFYLTGPAQERQHLYEGVAQGWGLQFAGVLDA